MMVRCRLIGDAPGCSGCCHGNCYGYCFYRYRMCGNDGGCLASGGGCCLARCRLACLIRNFMKGYSLLGKTPSSRCPGSSSGLIGCLMQFDSVFLARHIWPGLAGWMTQAAAFAELLSVSFRSFFRSRLSCSNTR